jgi:hypothetical protein
MNNEVFVFVYAKDNKIKVLGLEDSTQQHNTLLADGWVHTQTINACLWIEYLHNEYDVDGILEQIESLSKMP